MELFGDLRAGSRKWAGVAPSVSCAIIRANPSELRDSLLHLLPGSREHRQTGLKYDRGTSLTGAVDIQPNSASTHKTTNFREPSRVCMQFDFLVGKTGDQQEHKRA